MPIQDTITREQLMSAREQGASKEDVIGVMKTSSQRALVDEVFLGEEETPMNLNVDYGDLPDVSTKLSEEQAFYGAALSGSVNMVDSYYKIKNDLQSTGVSQDLNDVYTLLESERFESKKDAMMNLLSDPSLSPEYKEQLVNTYLTDRENDVNLAEEYIIRTATKNTPIDMEEAASKEVDISFIDDAIAYNNAISAEINKTTAFLEKTTKDSFIGFLELTLPFVEGVSTQIVKEAVVGEEGWFDRIKNTFLIGENKKALRDALSAMPPEQYREAVTKLLSAVKDLPGQNTKKLYIIEQALQSPDYALWQRGLDDVIGILDATMLGGIVSKGIKAGVGSIAHVHPMSPLGMTKVADSVEASRLAALALNDTTGEMTRAIGASKADIVTDAILPKWSSDVTSQFTDDVIEEMTRITNLASDINAQTATHGINYYEAEKIAAKAKVQQELVGAKGLQLHLNKSTIIDNGEEYSGLAVYGKTSTGGFGSSLKALERAVSNGLKNDEFVILKKNPKTKELDIIADFESEIGKTGSYFIGRNFTHIYNPADKARWGADAVAKIASGRLGGYLFDVISRFDNTISSSFLRAQDVASAIEKRLLDVVRSNIKGLNRDSKMKLFNVLEDGSKDAKVFTRAELATKYQLTEGEIRAYYSYRKVSDILWSMTNREYHRTLNAKGMVNVRGTSIGENVFAKPFKSANEVPNTVVFDPVAGSIRQLSRDEIKTLYDGGGSIAFLEKRASVGNQRATQILVDGNNVKYNKLPSNPLEYIEGYYQRTYKEYYYVDRVHPALVVDGRTITNPAELDMYSDTLAAASSKTEADKIIAELQAQNPDFRYTSRLGREFEDPMLKDYEIYKGGMRTTRSRGDHIVGIGESGLANIEDPIESLYRTVRAVSNKVAFQDVIDVNVERWKASFGHMTVGGEYPRSVAEINRAVANSTQEYKNAVSLFDYMESIKRTPSKIDAAWQTQLMDMAEIFERQSLKLADMTRSLAQINPTAAARKLPSTFFIALRPLRQVLVQSGQLLQLSFLDPKYILSGTAARELTAMSMARSVYGTALQGQGYKAAAKVMGVSEKEFAVLADTYLQKSGLPFSIDANWYVEGIVKDIHESVLASPTKRAAQYLAKPFAKTVEVSKRVGFDVGEFMNRTGSWLYARRRWMQNNPDIAGRWAEKQYADQIAADATKITYAMTQPGSFKYQKGILSLPLQFVAVPHKALLSVTTNKMWTKTEKAKILAANLALFGSYGVGLNTAFDALQEELGFELPEKMLIGLKGGMMDLGLNTLLQTMADEENDGTKVQFSKSFAPISEGVVPFTDVFSKFLNGDWVEMTFGPSYNLLHFKDGRFAKAIHDIRSITNTPDMSSMSKTMEVFAALGQLPSGVSDYMKYRAAKKTGMLLSSSGDPVVEATAHEALAKLFGFQTYSEDDAYRILRTIKDDEKGLREYAEWVDESVNRINHLYKTDKTQWESYIRKVQVLNAMLEPEELDRVSNYLEVLQDRRMSSVGENVIGEILKGAIAGGEIREDMVNIVRGSTLPEPSKTRLLELLAIGMDEEHL